MRRTDYKFVYPMLYFSFKQYAEFLNKIANYFEENKIAFLLCSDDEIEKKYLNTEWIENWPKRVFLVYRRDK